MGFLSGLGDALGVSDVFDTINEKLDDWTGQDWIGDLVATGGAIATGQWDEVAQHGLDLLEDGFEAVGWDEAAKWAKYGSELVDAASDLYYGRYAEAAQGAATLAAESGVIGDDTEPPPDTAEPSEAAAYWTEDVLQNGTDHFMKALMDGNKSAQAALKDPNFTMILQTKMKAQMQLVSTISNLIEAQHRTTMASVQNLRV